MTEKRRFELTEASLIKIDVDIDTVRLAAPMTSILEQADGGLSAVIAAMRFSADPGIMKFLRMYDGGTALDRYLIPWEAWAIKCKLDIPKLLGEILIALRQQSVNTIKVLAITAHAESVKAGLKEAKKPKGFKDRHELNVSLGFSPSPKGPTFIGKYFAGVSDIEEAEVKPTDSMDVNELFPDLSETQKMLTG